MPMLHVKDAIIKAALSAEQVVAMTIWAESRREPLEGQIAVGNVIRNRLLLPQRFGETWKAVCHAKWQFSCWIPQGGLENYNALMRRCELALENIEPWPEPVLWIAEGIISGRCTDRVGGATHYYSPAAMVPKGRVPDWAKGKNPVAIIGNHRFYKGV